MIQLSTLKKSGLTLALLLITLISRAQLSGTIAVPSGSYPDLAAVISALNTQGVSGAVTINLSAAQTAPVGGYLLGSATLNASVNATNTITINGNSNVITAPAGTITNSTTLATTNGFADAIINVSGTDYITMNGIVFTEPSTNNTVILAMEAAIAFYNLNNTAGADGCQNITINNCTFNMTKYGQAGAAIIALPMKYGVSTASTWAAMEDRHRDFNITNNNFASVYSAFFIRGLSGNTIRNVNFLNNTVTNMGGLGSVLQPSNITSYGVYPNQVDSLKMNNNTISLSNVHSTTAYAAYNGSSLGGYVEAKNNTITLQTGTTTSQTAGIYFSSMIGGNFEMTGNVLQFGSCPVITTGAFYGLYATYGGGGTNVRMNLSNNNCVNQTIPGNGTKYLIYQSHAYNLPGSTTVMANNNISGNTFTGYGTVYGIRGGYSMVDSLYNNSINNNTFTYTASGTTYFYCLYPYAYYAGDCQVYNNSIQNNTINNNSTSSAAYLYALYNYPAYAGTLTANVGGVKVFNNTIANLTIQGTSTSTSSIIYGLYNYNYGATVPMEIYNNTLKNITMGANTTTNTGSVVGFYLYYGNGTKVYNNFVNNITAYKPNGNIQAMALYYGDNYNIYNNFITDLSAPNSTNGSAILGLNLLYVNTVNSPINVSNNTIKFGSASATSTGLNYGASGINWSAGSLNLKNNIINIQGLATGTGAIIAVRKAVAGTAGVKPTGFQANNNIYYVNPAANNYLYAEGTTNTTLKNAYGVSGNTANATNNIVNDTAFSTSCGVYTSAFMGTSDDNAYAENNLVAGSIAGTYVPSGSSYAENAGLPISGITSDFANATRNATTPDMGALEFSGTAIDAAAPTIALTALPNFACTTIPAQSIAITDNSGVNTTSGTKPRMYYKKSTDANALVGNTATDNGWKYVEANNASSPYTFNMDFSILQAPLAVGDVMQYFVVAQDLNSTANVGINGAVFAAGYCPSSVNLLPAAFPVSNTNSFAITPASSVVVTATPNPVCENTPTTLYAVLNSSSPSLPTGYLNSNATSTADEEILNVSLGTNGSLLNNSSSCTSTGGAAGNGLQGSILNQYSNYTTGTVPVPNLAANQTVPYALTLGYCGSTFAYSNLAKIFIDYNRNGTFEASEQVAATNYGPRDLTGSVVTGSFTVPSTISMGYTLMRVVYVESSVVNATGTYSWGETEDYIVNLQGSPATISWQAGTSVVGTTNPLTITPTGSTNYIATVTDANGCSFIGGASVTMLPAPSAPTATNSIQCGTQVPTASVVSTAGAAGSGTMNWFAAATGGNALQSATSTTYTSSIASTTTFYVAEVGTNGCSSLRTPVTTTVNIPDVLTASASNTIDVCANTPITLSTTKTGSSNTYAYTWNATPATGSGIAATGTAGATNGSLVVTPTTAGTYVYTITGFDGGVTPNCSITSSVTVNVVDPWNGFAASTSPTTASICDGGSVNINSIINGPQTAPTGYLNSNATSTADEEILNVSLGTNGSLLNNTSSCTTTGGAAGNGLQASILNQYSNYTTVSSVPVPTITTGQVVPYALTLGYCSGTAYSNMAKVYIDYNRNGTFEAAEQVAVTNYGARAVTGDVVSGTFTVPTNAAPGKTLMRVVYVESSVVNPTGTYTWGETEDYFVNITTAPATLAWYEGATVLGTTPSLSYTSTVVGPHTINFAATSAVGGCVLNSSNTVVTVNAIPSAPSIAASVQCGTKVPTNTATSTAGSLGSGTFNWYTTATGGTPIETTTSGNLVNYQVATTTTLYVSEMSVAGCESARSPFLVTVNPIDPIFASASATANVCVNTPVALNVTKTGNQNTYVYNWTATPQANSGIATGGVSSNLNIPIVAIPSAAGTYAYKVTGTEASTGCAVTSTVNVSVIDPWNGFTATISPATTTVCSGIPAPLNAYIIGNQTLPSGYPTNSIATYVNYGEIFNVSLGANGSLLNNTSTCATTAGAAGNGLPASINQRYSNYTTVPTLQAPILAAGTTVPWSLNLGSCSFTTIFGYTIYIDFNRNGSFNDINEQVVVSGTTATYPLTGTVVSGTFTVPANIPTGKTLMRVIMAYNNGNQASDASYFYGETEDYAVNLVGANSNTIDWREGTTALGTGSSISYLGSVGSHIINYTATQANGCVISSQQATVNVLQLPTAPTATNSAHCGTKIPTASVTKTSGANGTGTFNWYTTPTGTTTAQVGTSTTFTSMISATTTFYVSEVGVNGCESARTPVTITVTPVDAITASASNTTNLCINTPVDLSVTQTGTNNTYLYTWTATPQAGSGIAATGISGATPSVTPTTAGVITYTVVGNQNGPAIYSNLAAGSTFDEDCGNVTITQGATTILNNTTTINSLVGTIGTAAGTASLRSDFTAFGPYTLNANGTYNLSITTLNQGTNYNHGIKAYIDYNRNGSFADAGETIYTSPALLAPPRTETASFTVPATALNGLTRLRVIVNEGNTLTPESAPTWGEVEEYTINLVTPNVGGGNPTTGCTTYSSINVNVINPWVGITASVTPSTANICGLGTPVSLTGTSGGPATLPTGYLNSNATQTADEEILNVSLGTAGSLLNNSSTCGNTGGAAGNGLQASILNQYSNYTTVSSVPVPSLAPGATVPYALTLGYCGSSFAYSNMAKMYIDYNRNGAFEAAEQVVATNYGARALSGDIVTGTFTVPTTASPGRTLMRVVYVESSVVNPTGTYTWGETEDYAIMIGTSAASQTWTEATTTLGTNTTLAYTPTSFGTKTITYTAADANGCKISANAILNVSQPAAPIVANVTLCQNSTATALTATALSGHTVKWYTTATGGTALTSAPIPSTTTAGTTTYYATQTTPQGCESLRTPLDVIVNPAPAFTSASSIAAVCNQTAINYTPTSSVTGATFAWSRASVSGISNAAASGTASINENLNNTSVNPVVVTYVYTTTDPSTGCTSTNNVTATVNPAATLTSATSAPAICNNTAFAYSPTSATAGTTYTWSRAAVSGISNGAANGTGAINETLINTTANPVTVTYNYVLTANGCSNTQSITVVVNPSATMSSALTANVCSERLYKYTPLSATAGTTYAWSRAAVTGITNTAATGTGAISETLTNSTQAPINVTYVYTLTANGCSNTQNLVVTVNPTPAKLIITADGPTVFCKEESVVLRFNPTNTGTYQWYQDGVPVSGATATNTTVYTAGSFTAIVTNSYGCASDPSTAMLVEVPCEIGISLPDIFTPNGDGSNDKIKPIVPGIHTFSFFRVYNRWGNLVFESTDPDAAWDGSYKGEMQPQDSYSYVIEGYNFRMELIRKQGTITLVR
jgi:gliding motility-associated-like protein